MLASPELGESRASAPTVQLDESDGRPGRAIAAFQIIQALFAAARQRRRRIRATAAVSLAVALAGTALGIVLYIQSPVRATTPGSGAGVGMAHSPTSAQLVWADGSGRIVIGNLAKHTQRVVSQADADVSAPLVAFGGHVYWVKESGGFVDGAFWPRTIEELTVSTGKSVDVGPGEFAFPSADGSHLYVSQADNVLAEIPLGGAAESRPVTLPAGWYMPLGRSMALANGILVQSVDVPLIARPAELAVWNPRTGALDLVGRSVGAVAAYTPPGATYSLLAWAPAGCRVPACNIVITDTATMTSRTIESPLGHGFVLGGAFSPDGRQLATFANRTPRPEGLAAELALVGIKTGAVRLVDRVQMQVGTDTDWVHWTADGQTLIVIGNRNYLVPAATVQARSFAFTGAGQGINYSAALLPRS